MLRASEGSGGALIGNLTYRPDYESAVGEEKVLRRAAAEKKCDLPPPPAPPASAAPAVYGPASGCARRRIPSFRAIRLFVDAAPCRGTVGDGFRHHAHARFWTCSARRELADSV